MGDTPVSKSLSVTVSDMLRWQLDHSIATSQQQLPQQGDAMPLMLDDAVQSALEALKVNIRRAQLTNSLHCSQ
jgi:hypothetical protein